MCVEIWNSFITITGEKAKQKAKVVCLTFTGIIHDMDEAFKFY